MRIVVISGLSGAGKSCAIKTFEDIGFYGVDNLPVLLLEDFIRVLEKDPSGMKEVALVIDARDQSYLDRLPVLIDEIRKKKIRVEVIFLDSSDAVLAQRFSETRRKHPLAKGTIVSGIRKEREILRPIRSLADTVIDTSEMSTSALRKFLTRIYGASKGERRLAVSITSFGFKYGLPLNADMVFDARFLVNPFFQKDLKHKTGLHPKVSRFVLTQKPCKAFLRHLEELVLYLIPLFEKESKSYLNICVGCTGGKHRSVAIAAELFRRLERKGVDPELFHRDMELE